jgi:NCAIR mutase (PurE)-related protein
LPVAQEAKITAEIMGQRTEVICDVGVAGIHRLLDKVEKLQSANVIIVVAGMEGALAGVVGGLVDCPVIAVPTSVGSGTGFGGFAALLTMLNSCASGVTVVNIDNGFSAAVTATLINRKIEGNL